LKDPAPISAIKPMTPPALDHAIRRRLAKDRGERWQNARDLARELDWISEEKQTNRMTAATSRERNCSWMAALHKCRPQTKPDIADSWRLRSNGQPESYQLARWISTDKR
jgi:hypothetical protein